MFFWGRSCPILQAADIWGYWALPVLTQYRVSAFCLAFQKIGLRMLPSKPSVTLHPVMDTHSKSFLVRWLLTA